ncbi:nucleotidyltransferase domain-containing protein [Xylanimonas protaetiae]|uniref:Nucleotidyltransferase domain-containing protein n=2 Tax=Xylanimonas protaetiae TaxID=2509457 RepID=A0A4P6F6Y5_9MICO|nr:nucleotidyltransferase domain-containing protein [Xylanimonas protaetiae]
MRIQRPMAVVTPTLDGDVLTVLARASAAFTPGQVSRLVPGGSVDGIRKALNRLVDEGTVIADRAGNAYTYRLNNEHLAAEPIVALARLRETLIVRLTQTVAAWTPAPTYAAIFGSAARGEMRSDSDIDLFLVRPEASRADQWDEQVADLALAARRWTGNDVRPLVMSRSEVTAGVAPTDDGLVEPVLEDIAREGIAFAGPSAWLSRQIRTARRIA